MGLLLCFQALATTRKNSELCTSPQKDIAEDFREASSLGFGWFLFGDKVLCFPG